MIGIGFYLSSAGRAISILLVRLCHSAYDRNKWNLWKSEAKDNPVSNSNLVCNSSRKKQDCDIMLVSLFCLLTPYFSLFIFTNLISPRNSLQRKEMRVSLGRPLQMLHGFVRKEKDFFVAQGNCPWRLTEKKEEILKIVLFSAVYMRHQKLFEKGVSNNPLSHLAVLWTISVFSRRGLKPDKLYLDCPVTSMKLLVVGWHMGIG